eukprot:m.162539 g.162539  ORF g.162539 m.162539 type:complete len:90 (+) comp15206_c0_seq5:75-344(+)
MCHVFVIIFFIFDSAKKPRAMESRSSQKSISVDNTADEPCNEEKFSRKSGRPKTKATHTMDQDLVFKMAKRCSQTVENEINVSDSNQIT